MGLHSHWQQDFVAGLGAQWTAGCKLTFPPEIAHGDSYFLEIIPGLTALIADYTFHKSIEFVKAASEADYCIAYYDLSEEISLHHVNGEKYKVGYQSQLGMGVVDGVLESSYTPPIGERMYSFRLLIAKKLLYKHLDLASPLEDAKDTICFYDHIDSRTRIALLDLKTRNFGETSFYLTVKGVALTAFGNLVERMAEKEPQPGLLSEQDAEHVLHTQQYLMEHLRESFMGLEQLSTMAQMSATKYQKLFRKLFGESANNFFLREKLRLAKKLLQSGQYARINEVAYELGYSKPGHFASAYNKLFNVLPKADFLAKVEN